MTESVPPFDDGSAEEPPRHGQPFYAAWSLILAAFGLISGAAVVFSQHKNSTAKGFEGVGYSILEILGSITAYAVVGIGLVLSVLSIRRREAPPWPRAGLYANLFLAAAVVIFRLTFGK